MFIDTINDTFDEKLPTPAADDSSDKHINKEISKIVLLKRNLLNILLNLDVLLDKTMCFIEKLNGLNQNANTTNTNNRNIEDLTPNIDNDTSTTTPTQICRIIVHFI